MDRLARISNQAIYANSILKGVADLGEFSRAFADTIRKDLAQYSQVHENPYLIDFMNKRSPDIWYPTREMPTYEFKEVLDNALLEFNLEIWRQVRRTTVNWTQFSVAVLYLIAESSTYYCWTAELFRRCDCCARERDLMGESPTYRNLIRYGRSLVYWLRHCQRTNPNHGGFQRIEELWRAGVTGLIQNSPYNSPSVLAILISCMHKDRFGVTVGVKDKYSPVLRTTLFVCCTHGHSTGEELLIPGISWEPNLAEQLLAVHGTSFINWRAIVRDKAMITLKRRELHFSDFRPGMMIKEMYQLKHEGTYLFVDPAHLHHSEDFQVTINLTDVCKVLIGTNGMDIRHLLTTVKYNGDYADLTNYQVPRTPTNWVPLVDEFLAQLKNPATPLYDDSRGTTGPLAKQRVEQAETLRKEYSRMASTLSLVTDAAPIPEICSQEDFEVDVEACTNPKNNALVRCRANAEPMVQSMIDFYKTVETEHKNNQQLTTVNPPSGSARQAPKTPDVPIAPHDNADYSNSECESYYGDSEEAKPRHIFTDNELAEFEVIYLDTAVDLTNHYQGLSLLEAQVIVQAYCICRKLPTGVRPAPASYKLAFDTSAAKIMCANFSPPDPATSIRKSNLQPDLRSMFVTEYDQYEVFQELQDKDVFWTKWQWLKEPLFRKLRFMLMNLPKTENWVPRWFTPDEIYEAADELPVSFHDPCGHSQFFRLSHILPQGCWIPNECFPTSEEQTLAKQELSLNSEFSTARAVQLLSGSHIPHDQHEYSQVGPCEMCADSSASVCLVCGVALCNVCKNNMFPYKDDDGTPSFVESHPVQCDCTMRDFQLALMQARKSEKLYNLTWSVAPEGEEIAPLAALCFIRSLITFGDTSATVLDYQKDTPQSNAGINVPILSKGEDSLEPAEDGASDEEEYLVNLEASSLGSYYNQRLQDRQFLTGATSPLELQNVKEATAPPNTKRVVKEILSLKDVPFTQVMVDKLTEFDEAATLNADQLGEARHSFRNRVDLPQESRLNQGGAAAYNAYVHRSKELIPFNLTFFGRGKAQDAESDVTQYAEPGFAPVRGDQPSYTHPEPVQKAIEWSEHILTERLKGNYPLDGRPDETILRHHNDVVRDYWIHTGLLQPNNEQKRNWYEWPIHGNRWNSGPIWNYIGNP